MVTSTKESGLTIKPMEGEPTSMWMELSMPESGMTTSRMATVWRHGPTEPSTKAATSRVKSVVAEPSNGQTRPCSSASS